VQAKEPASPGPSRLRPLLLIDIDGVISLFGFSPQNRPEGAFHAIDGIPHFLSTAAAQNLLGLVSVFDFVWCTGWEEKADEYLPHLLGVPRGLPFLSFERDRIYEAGGVERSVRAEEGEGEVAAARVTRAHWKLKAIDAYAGPRRALAWIDDAFDDSCHAWAAERQGPTLLVQTAPHAGLTEQEAKLLGEWAAML